MRLIREYAPEPVFHGLRRNNDRLKPAVRSPEVPFTKESHGELRIRLFPQPASRFFDRPRTPDLEPSAAEHSDLRVYLARSRSFTAQPVVFRSVKTVVATGRAFPVLRFAHAIDRLVQMPHDVVAVK